MLKQKSIIMNIIVHEHQVSYVLLVRYYDDDSCTNWMFDTTIERWDTCGDNNSTGHAYVCTEDSC